MIEISSAVSSSISSMSAGIDVEPGQLGGAPAALAGDELVAVRSDRADEDGLQDAMLADRRGELVERLLVEGQARLLGVRLDVVDRDDADADAARRRVGRQQADDGGGELALLGQAAGGRRAEVRPRQGPPPLARARDTCEPPRCCPRTT